LYHDGSNSYLNNATGTLFIGTNASAVPVSIGHTTSETTVNDNLTVTGNMTIAAGTGNVATVGKSIAMAIVFGG
jgi:hypothetical protein